MFIQLSHEDAEKMIANNNVVIADVRDEESYNKGHIDNAIHLTMQALNDFCESADKSTPVIVYCYHGISSQSVAQHLVEYGFNEVYSLIGGYEKWNEHHRTE